MASSDHLKPGEKGQIIAKIDTNGRAGLLMKNIKVFSNDPKTPVKVLTLTAQIRTR
jgi:hypothetical protein